MTSWKVAKTSRNTPCVTDVVGSRCVETPRAPGRRPLMTAAAHIAVRSCATTQCAARKTGRVRVSARAKVTYLLVSDVLLDRIDCEPLD